MVPLGRLNAIKSTTTKEKASMGGNVSLLRSSIRMSLRASDQVLDKNDGSRRGIATLIPLRFPGCDN